MESRRFSENTDKSKEIGPFAGGISSWKESRIGGKARRAANKIRKRFRRVFGRSVKSLIDTPHQELDVAGTQVGDFIEKGIHESSSDTHASSSPEKSDIYASFSSANNLTIRIVPPTPRRLPVYVFSEGYENPQDVAYSESVYSKSESATSLEPEEDPLELSDNDEIQSTSGSAVILETITYQSTTPRRHDRPISCPVDPVAWMPWKSDEDEEAETVASSPKSSTGYINEIAVKTEPVTYGHVRENAQINDDDRSIAQEPITIKQPLGELQRDARLNFVPAPVLKPIPNDSPMRPLAENINLSLSKPPPPPPLPLQPHRLAGKPSPSKPIGSSSTVLPQSSASEQKTPLPGTLVDIVISSRNKDSPTSLNETPTKAVEHSALQCSPQRHHPLHDVDLENKAPKTTNRGHERLWKVESVPQICYNHDSLRNMLAERGNNKRRFSANGISNVLDTPTGNESEPLWNMREGEITNYEGKTGPHDEGKDEDVYGVEGAGLMGPSIASRNIQLVDSLLSNRRSRIIGYSESDSDDAFI